MVAFPNAKINLGLNIISKRPDGFHNLESCFYPVNWRDILEILPSDQFTFSSSGIEITGDPGTNLCVRAYTRLKEQYKLPPVHIHLHKNIPTGAGLGGGSSDAAFTVKVLNNLFDLGLTEFEMENTVRPLGSDCPFFIQNKPVYAYDKGDKFEPLALDLKGKFIIIIYPALSISTPDAYKKITPAVPKISIKTVLQEDLSLWKKQLRNDFEEAIFPEYSILKKLKDLLYDQGAFYASMSGSGSCIYGIFEQETCIKTKLPPDYTLWQGEL